MAKERTMDWGGLDLWIRRIFVGSMGPENPGDELVVMTADNLDNPGTDATTIGADKVLKITVGGVDYWVPLVDNNT